MVVSHVESGLRPLPLEAVRLGDSPFRRAMEANGRYLLQLSPDRLLHNFYLNAGIPTKGDAYGGWEQMGIASHTLGHYLSALSLQFASTAESEFLARSNYIVDVLAQCQVRRGNGYVGGIPNEDRLWSEIAQGDIRSKGFDLNGCWVPWYTLHKLFAGLLDAHELTGNKKALEIAITLAQWAEGLLAPLSDQVMQTMLVCEYGGMNDVLARLFEVTSNEAHLALAKRFFDHVVLDALLDGRDELSGKHANTQIPKMIGLLRIGLLSNDYRLVSAAKFFWDRVANHHSYAIGGHSDHEHFGAPDMLADRLSTETAESCNTYNMLKLSKDLFRATGDWRYMDFYELGLVNHILASQDPESGMVCYFVSLLPGTSKVYSTPFDSFWCCVGTGIESHAKYGESVGFNRPGCLLIAQYIPSTIQDSGTGLHLEIHSAYPQDGKVSVRVLGSLNTDVTLEFRKPWYCCETPEVVLNGKNIGRTLSFTRVWQVGDFLEFEFEMPIFLKAMPDRQNRVSVGRGPNILAAILPGNARSGTYDVVLNSGQEVLQLVREEGGDIWLEETTGHAGSNLVPFWQATHEKTAVYFDLFSEEEWAAAVESRQTERERLADIERRTVDHFRPGEMQSERDHQFFGVNTETGGGDERKWRHATDGGWFEFQLNTRPGIENNLVLTFWGTDGPGRTFHVAVDGLLVKTFSFDGLLGPTLYDEAITLGPTKQRSTIRFQAEPGNIAGGLYRAAILTS